MRSEEKRQAAIPTWIVVRKYLETRRLLVAMMNLDGFPSTGQTKSAMAKYPLSHTVRQHLHTVRQS